MESNTSLFVALDASTHNQQILNLSFCQKELWAVGVAHGDLTSMQLLLQCKTDKGSQTQHTGIWNWCKRFWVASMEHGFDRQDSLTRCSTQNPPSSWPLETTACQGIWMNLSCMLQMCPTHNYAFANLKTGTEKPSCNFENHQSE